MTCAWQRESFDSVRVLHHVDYQASAYMPSNVAVECPDARVVRSHLPYHITPCWHYLHITALRVRWVDDRPAIPSADTNALLSMGG